MCVCCVCLCVLCYVLYMLGECMYFEGGRSGRIKNVNLKIKVLDYLNYNNDSY